MESGVGLTQLVRDLRSAETKGLPLTPVPLRAAIDDVAMLLHDRLAQKDIRLECDIHDCTILAEPWSLRNSVIENLASNAIKFSPRGARLELRTDPPAEGRVTLRVRDHGIGIPPALVANLFAIQKNVSRPGTEGERGTGFGMPLVERCVQLYGGTITVDSHEAGPGVADPGTEFRLTFQLA